MSHWRSAIPIILAATLGLVAAWTPMSIGTGRLHADPIPGAELALNLTEPLLTPAMIQERGVATLSGAFAVEAYNYWLNYHGTTLDAEFAILKVVLLVPFAWLLLESRRPNAAA